MKKDAHALYLERLAKTAETIESEGAAGFVDQEEIAEKTRRELLLTFATIAVIAYLIFRAGAIWGKGIFNTFSLGTVLTLVVLLVYGLIFFAVRNPKG